jgi:hypothetical protein
VSTTTCGSTILYGRPRKTFGKGRVCGHNGCQTIVNQYNPAAYCYRHEALHGGRFNVDSVLFLTKHCPSCGKDLPASSDYWYRDASEEDGFKSWCKRCKAKSEAAA